MNKVYLAGDMLSKGAQRQREYEAEQLRNLGLDLHVPQEDKSINDKANAIQEGLAERIVSNDTQGIIESDVIIIDAHENGKGTLVELGQVKGMKDMAMLVKEKLSHLHYSEVSEVQDLVDNILGKKVFPHNTDVRRENRKLQAGDRREYAPNQYVYGTVLDLTNGHGFYEFEEITEELNPVLSRVKAAREKQIDICEKARELGFYTHRINFEVMSNEQLANEAYNSVVNLKSLGVKVMSYESKFENKYKNYKEEFIELLDDIEEGRLPVLPDMRAELDEVYAQAAKADEYESKAELIDNIRDELIKYDAEAIDSLNVNYHDFGIYVAQLMDDYESDVAGNSEEVEEIP